MKIVFMGTPDFAVTALNSIVKEGHTVAEVVTQPDRASGRNLKKTFSPVKEAAAELNIPVSQPERVSDPGFIRHIADIAPDVIVVAAYGQILPEAILSEPEYGCLNIHASLLPKYRGAAPIQRAIINGEKRTGVTIMRMDKGLDTGDIVDQVAVDIDSGETAGTLHDKLAGAGGRLILKTLSDLKYGTAVFTPQRGEDSSYAAKINKDMRRVSFNDPADQIERKIRALSPSPGAYTVLGRQTVKLWRAKTVKSEKKLSPGTVFNVTKESFCVAAADGGALIIEELQIAGGKKLKTADFLRGHFLKDGDLMG